MVLTTARYYIVLMYLPHAIDKMMPVAPDVLPTYPGQGPLATQPTETGRLMQTGKGFRW